MKPPIEVGKGSLMERFHNCCSSSRSRFCGGQEQRVRTSAARF